MRVANWGYRGTHPRRSSNSPEAPPEAHNYTCS